MENCEQIKVQVGIGEAKWDGRFFRFELTQDVGNRAGAPVSLKAEFVGEEQTFQTSTIVSDRSPRKEMEDVGVTWCVLV